MSKETIGFGTLFDVKDEVADPSGKTFVVVDVLEGNSIMAAQVLEAPGGETAIIGGGTTSLEHIQEITGQISLEEVIAGHRRGYEMKGFNWRDEYNEILEEKSQKEAREIELG